MADSQYEGSFHTGYVRLSGSPPPNRYKIVLFSEMATAPVTCMRLLNETVGMKDYDVPSSSDRHGCPHVLQIIRAY